MINLKEKRGCREIERKKDRNRKTERVTVVTKIVRYKERRYKENLMTKRKKGD